MREIDATVIWLNISRDEARIPSLHIAASTLQRTFHFRFDLGWKTDPKLSHTIYTPQIPKFDYGILQLVSAKECKVIESLTTVQYIFTIKISTFIAGKADHKTDMIIRNRWTCHLKKGFRSRQYTETFHTHHAYLSYHFTHKLTMADITILAMYDRWKLLISLIFT